MLPHPETGNNGGVKVEPADVPIATWKEHWFEHVQNLERISYDTSVVIYYDKDVSRDIVWPKKYMAEAWNYTKKTYGSFGPDPRLYAIYHAGKYSGGHPPTYMDESHDYHNVTDCGSDDVNAWISGKDNDIDLSTHEIGHIVEGASKVCMAHQHLLYGMTVSLWRYTNTMFTLALAVMMTLHVGIT